MPDAPTPEMLKRMRMDEEATPQNGSVDNGESRAATVEDVDEDAEQMEVDFAPGGDADYFAEEDGEGRFYGGGLTQEQKDILNIFDRAGGEEAREDVSIPFESCCASVDFRSNRSKSYQCLASAGS